MHILIKLKNIFSSFFIHINLEINKILVRTFNVKIFYKIYRIVFILKNYAILNIYKYFTLTFHNNGIFYFLRYPRF